MYMLPTNLTTNEVKDSAGTEIEFLRQSTADRKVVFAKSGETPNAPHRITIQHSEIGSGVALRRRSNIRVDKTVSGVDGSPVTPYASLTVDFPIGNLSATTEMVAVLANLVSIVASDGTNTTVKFDCSGTAAAALINGAT